MKCISILNSLLANDDALEAYRSQHYLKFSQDTDFDNIKNDVKYKDEFEVLLKKIEA